MIPREYSGPFLRDLSSGSSVKMQYDCLILNIQANKTKWKVNLDEQERKANEIWQNFQATTDAEGESRALQGLSQVSDETSRITAIGEFDLMLSEIDKAVVRAGKLQIDIQRIVETARHSLMLFKEEVPAASPYDITFKERAADQTMMIFRNEYRKKEAAKRIENIVLELQDQLDPAVAKPLFDQYAERIHGLNRRYRVITSEMRDGIVEEFREQLEFTAPDLALKRSNLNKEFAVAKMDAFLRDNPSITDDADVKRLYEAYKTKLQSGALMKIKECLQIVHDFGQDVKKLFS